MGVMANKTRYKQLQCLYSKRTGNQLGPLAVADAELADFIARADPAQYGIATVNFKEQNGVWVKTSSTPGQINFLPQFLTAEQRKILLDEK